MSLRAVVGWYALLLACSSEEAGHPRSAPTTSNSPATDGEVSVSASAPPAAAGTPSTSADVPAAPVTPAELIKLLSPKPYVEERCEPTTVVTFAGPAQRCRYQVMGIAAEVVVANPDAERVARWIVDAAAYAAPLEAIRHRAPALWKRGLFALARHVRQQSSRIFPIAGEIVEDLGPGPRAFTFDRGVVTPCDKGSCRCRVNSIAPGTYCRYLESTGGDRAACLAKYQGQGATDAWRQHCVDNHQRAMNSGHNDHFRAKALALGSALEEKCTARGCTPLELVQRLEKDLGL